MRLLLIAAFSFIFSSSISLQESVDFNPYEVLGVGQSASTADIRTEYKKLVKEWHPDKNKSPNAQDKFIKIQQAYEILSDENKREQYDTGGYSGDSVGQWHQYSEPFNFRYSEFSHDFFNSQGSSRTVSLYDYYNKVLPESHHTPHLIYVYSTFCGQCILWLRTTWHKAATDLESLGVSVYTVDTTFTSRIASNLGVSRIPTIVGLYKEKVHFFKGQISKEELKFFVNSFLPSNLITQVTTANVKDFLTSIEYDDKPRAILFSEKNSPTLLYSLMAIKYQKYIKFGFVRLRDMKTNGIVKSFGVSTSGPSLYVFKENTEKPAVVLGASEMPRGAINEILSLNKFVSVPRLTSQDVFDEVCPAPQGTHTVRLCMILVSDPSYKDHKVFSSTLKKLVELAESKEESLHEWLKFMQVHASKQPAFTRSLMSDEIKEARLLLLWRRGQKMSSVKHTDVTFLRGPFDIAKQEFQVRLRTALEAVHLQRFQSTVSLSPLVDELAPFFVLQILQSVVEILEYVYGFIISLSEKHFMTVVILTVLWILIIRSWLSSDSEEGNTDTSGSRKQKSKNKQREGKPDVATGGAESCNTTHSEQAKPDGGHSSPNKTTPTRTSPKRQIPDFIHELIPSIYENAVLKQSRGHMTVVLLIDNDANDVQDLMKEYQETMQAFRRDPKVSITFLDVRKYSSWYCELRRTSSAEPPGGDIKDEKEEMSSLHGNHFGSLDSQSDYTLESVVRFCGTVLALNGARHWYCTFVPRGVKWSHKDKAKNSQNVEPQSVEEETYTDALSCWMDRVREGQWPRLYVRQWPGLYVHAPTNNDEEDDF